MSFNYPRILNLIWDSSKLTFLNYLTIVSFKRYHIDWDIHIYYTTKTDTKLDKKWSTPEQKVELEEHVQDYWSRVSEIPGVKMICVDEFIRSLDLSALHPVQQSDIIRIYVLYTYGGVYSDFDVIYLKNIEDYFLPYGETNLLFFGLEPNGYIYFPVGFFISKPQQECYKQILRLQLSESKNAESSKDYQYFGAALFRRLKSSNNSLLSSFRLLPSKCYLPVCWFEIEKKLYGGGKHCPIDTDSFAVHWFNGSSTSKKYINNFRNLEYTCPPIIEIKCTMDYLVSGYIKELTSATCVENVITPPIPRAIDIEAVEQSREPKISIVMAYINRYRQLQHTLNTISKSLYKNIEVVIVDDGSIQDQRLENLIYQYDFEITLTRIEPSDKKWVNPCIPYNIALSKATGDIIIIQNPEVCHVGDIIQYCRDNITDNKYLTFSVISSGGEVENEKIYNYKDIIPHWDVQQVFTPQSWYNHPTCRNSQFHFLSCMTRNTLSQIGGFNENFRNGLSYDDDEFITRLRKVVECVTLSPEVGFGIHLWHPGGSIFYDTKVDLLQTLVNINSQLHRELVNSSVLYYPRGDCSKYTTLNNKNVIVFGGTGMLGRYVTTYLKSKGFNVVEVNREHIDVESIVDISPIENLLEPHIKPNTVIVNCIGKIPQKMDNTTANLKTFTIVNTLFPRYLSIIVEKFNHSRRGAEPLRSLNRSDSPFGREGSALEFVPPGIGCRFINITTDCVFSGGRGDYTENDIADAVDVYGSTKSLGETRNDTVIRTSIIGEELKGKKSLLEWIKSNKNGIVGGFTRHYWNGVTCLELSKIIYEIIRQGLYWKGVRHIYSPSKVSKYQLVSYINTLWNLDIKINEIEGETIDRSLKSIYDTGVNSVKNIQLQLQELRQYNL
jgi:dTDP-4-dehydrorhamnose reductase